MQRHGWKGRLAAFAAVVGIALAATTGAAEARRSLRADMDLNVTVAANIAVPDKGLVAYVGTLDFGRNHVYGMVFYSLGPPEPWFRDVVTYAGSWEIYDATPDDFAVFDPDTGMMTAFDPPPAIMVADDWGFGSFERNWFVGFSELTFVDDHGIRLFRGVDEGDHAFWRGAFVEDQPLFLGSFRQFRH